jgi:DNA-binding transcriptional ArsR family regulator
MATDVTPDLTQDIAASFVRAQEELQRKRAEFDQMVEEQRKQFDFRAQMIEQARDGISMAFGDITFPSDDDSHEGDEVPKLSISEKHLKRIEEYLANKGKVRQADLVEKLSLNSGTVSVGLRRLEQAGLIAKAPKERGSRVWEHTAPSDKKRREMVVAVGEGTREGRLVQN